MPKIVKITRNGQANIPAEIRKKLGLKEGDKLAANMSKDGVVFKSIPKMEDCAGIFAGRADVAELKKEIDKLREGL